jgi:sugar O-acyltransferase (sialic acid O-acetyltransferase NeuD family)
MMKNIVIIGSGGFAKEVEFLIKNINRSGTIYNFLGYVENEVGMDKIVGNDDWLLNYDKQLFVAMGIGNPSLAKKLATKFAANKKLVFPNLIHPKAIGDWENIELGRGNIICAGNIFTTDIRIGSFNIFNLSCTLGHDAIIGDFNVFNPTVNLSGGINIGNGNLIGTGSQVLQYVNIRSHITVGAGAVVTKDLVEEGTYIGIPAKKYG